MLLSMKRMMFLFVLVLMAMSVTAAFPSNVYTGDISSDENVVCLRERTGLAHFKGKELKCFVDNNGNGAYEGSEPVIGCGKSIANIGLRAGSTLGRAINIQITPFTKNIYQWETESFKPSYSYYYKDYDCNGTVILTGRERQEFLLANGCSLMNGFEYCCPEEVFEEAPKTISFAEPLSEEKKSSDSMVMVIDRNRWALAKQGKISSLFFDKALKTEKIRCDNGGGDLWTFDVELGGYFSDLRNYRDGDRVFLFTRPDYSITPLISYCD